MDPACGVNVLDGGKSDFDDLFSHPHHSLQALVVQSGAVSKPGSDAATQESGENGQVGGGLSSVETLLGFLHGGA